VVVDLAEGPKVLELATRDTPDALKRALADAAKLREQAAAAPPAGGEAEKKGGLFGWLKRG
jgi:molecular chaperone DnaK